MPRFDGRGPMGYGPMTGRGMGYCARPGRRPMRGGGFYGRRGGFGRGYYGYGGPYYDEPYYAQAPSKEFLEDQKKYLEEELEAIKKQLEELVEK